MVSYGALDIEENEHYNTEEECEELQSPSKTLSWFFKLLATTFALLFVLYSLLLLEARHQANVQRVSMSDVSSSCVPGVMNNSTEMQFAAWSPPSIPGLILPLYWTQSLDEKNDKTEHAVIVQHGNLRNANDYFCGAINSLIETGLDNDELQRFLIIAPIFLTEGDKCWSMGSDYNFSSTVSLSEGVTCGFPVWSSEGWKDGHLPVNIEALSSTIAPEQAKSLFSYEILNVYMRALANRSIFPNLRKITLFGFSAGGQTVLRYSLWPDFQLSYLSDRIDRSQERGVISVQYVVADVSSYVYFDQRRPLVNGSAGYAVPSAQWLEQAPWKVDSVGLPWIESWDGNCLGYDEWRYGLEKFQGYFEYHMKVRATFRQEITTTFPGRNLHFLVGMNDSLNCKLHSFDGCDDNELATYCQAMLQGDNRLDRFEKWRHYLEDYYHSDSTIDYTYVNNVTHDPVAMLHSHEAQCLVFGDRHS